MGTRLPGWYTRTLQDLSGEREAIFDLGELMKVHLKNDRVHSLLRQQRG